MQSVGASDNNWHSCAFINQRTRSQSFAKLIALYLACSPILLASAQYNQQSAEGYEMAASNYARGGDGGYGGGGGGYGGYGNGGHEDSGYDERPKVHVGLRLRIPAIKFQLPRFSLPKITVSAKIRQPDRPRTITLPEINLDTSSKVDAQKQQGAYGGDSSNHGSYSSASYHQPSYGQQSSGYGQQYAGDDQEKTSMFTFSTDEHPTNGYGSRTNYYGAGSGKRHNYRPLYQQQPYQTSTSYGATNARPVYSMSQQQRQSPTQQQYHHQQHNMSTINYRDQQHQGPQYGNDGVGKNSDIGFEAPARR